jgi:hypothetical protein
MCRPDTIVSMIMGIINSAFIVVVGSLPASPHNIIGQIHLVVWLWRHSSLSSESSIACRAELIFISSPVISLVPPFALCAASSSLYLRCNRHRFGYVSGLCSVHIGVGWCVHQWYVLPLTVLEVGSPIPGAISFHANIPSFLVLDGVLSFPFGDFPGVDPLDLFPALVDAYVFRDDTAAVRAMICSCSGLGASHSPSSLEFYT